MNDVARRLGVLLRARYPIVQILTHEEDRADRALEKLAAQEGRALHRWRCTTGLVGPDGAAPGTEGAAAALAAAASIAKPALFCFFDSHAWLTEPEVVRRLRDLARDMGGRAQSLVLVGPRLVTPPELDKDIAVLDFPLPGREEVGRLLGMLLRSESIDVPPDRFERFVQGSLGLTEREIQRLYARILLSGEAFSDGDLAALVEEKRQAIRQSRYLEFWDSPGGLDQVGGMDALKRWLAQRSAGFSERARAFGLPEPKGLFLLGVQGCGKSLVAKSIAGMWRFPLLRLDVAALLGQRGQEDEGLRRTIRVAETLAPAVLWIDELEKGLAGGAPGEGGAGSRAFGDFLTWMQEKTSPVFVVATANEVRALPPELLRKGRFDEVFFVDLPDVHERLEVLEIHLRRRLRDPEKLELTSLAEETEKFSGAELEQVVVAGLFHAFEEGRELGSDDLVEAARETVPLAVTMDDRLKELREWARPRARPASTDRRRLDFFEEWEESE